MQFSDSDVDRRFSWWSCCRRDLGHGADGPGGHRGLVLLHAEAATAKPAAAAATKPAALLRLHRQRGGGLPEHAAGGGEDGGDPLQHLGHQVQDPRGGPQPPATPRTGQSTDILICNNKKSLR